MPSPRSGCRKSDILTLRWQDVDLEARGLKLADSKTGARTVPISREAADVLANIPRLEGSPCVVPGNVKGRPMCSLNDPWKLVCKRAGIKERAASRLQAQLRLQSAGARRRVAGDRGAPGSCRRDHNRKIRSPCPGFHSERCCENHREHRREFAGRTGNRWVTYFREGFIGSAITGPRKLAPLWSFRRIRMQLLDSSTLPPARSRFTFIAQNAKLSTIAKEDRS